MSSVGGCGLPQALLFVATRAKGIAVGVHSPAAKLRSLIAVEMCSVQYLSKVQVIKNQSCKQGSNGKLNYNLFIDTNRAGRLTNTHGKDGQTNVELLKGYFQ